ncbi:MAG: hypothetical protein A3F13_01510 [Gammaproteobacteria bacterium RIFCSPHIGHO2_12_FULL_40_19]|nr:MAG: hypothetical protein A3F13_01510 [Gammaproteobacteria bacterium RIFCSPHIGHO2_12_FULL_40_19]
MRFFALFMLFCASMFLLGCAKHSNDYLKKGGEISSLVVPTDVPVIKQAPYYPIPAAAANGSAKPNSLLPPTLQK